MSGERIKTDVRKFLDTYNSDGGYTRPVYGTQNTGLVDPVCGIAAPRMKMV
jgi:hypothetical protein